jgi:site-specific DNA-cytosine methylase
LALVQEHLEHRGMGNVFHHQHVFSCEVEPFKQAYLARNFDSVLYPDICKLTEDPPIDCYGQAKPIPGFNLFVAGTSCKNFSMMRANKRLDIEDHGCSGETFLAAMEFLFQQKPPFALLENVMGAPWEKMQEYITGRVKLSSCGVGKAIKKDGKIKAKELDFAFDSGRIVVECVPAVYGVQCGIAVKGFFKGGSDVLKEVTWPTNVAKGKHCTLQDLMQSNGIKKEDDTLVFDVPVSYCTKLISVDTKDFGLPQTRNRKYLFVWQSTNIHDDLGTYWEAVVEHLQNPVRNSLEAFILQPDHDMIRVFREGLRGPAGRQTKHDAFLQPDFWSGSSKDLSHCKMPREKLGLEELARSLTQWGPYGAKHMPPHYWLEYVNCFSQRQLDMLDILHGSAARDAEGHDSNFASFVWNVTQSASREKHRTATPGISSCVTPGGDFLLPHLGRPLLGCEKLLLQGIPYFRLALGNETEVQLGDLAGNAMSLTVVSACMLAALTCEQLRRDHPWQKDNSATLKDKVRNEKAFLASLKEKLRKEEKTYPLTANTIVEETVLHDSRLEEVMRALMEVAQEAVNTSIWCTV